MQHFKSNECLETFSLKLSQTDVYELSQENNDILTAGWS